jgi:hypothetical protein
LQRAGGFDTNVLVGGDEIGLFRRLRRVGLTRYTDELWVETDPRRTEVGFVRFFFGTVMLHYVFNYPFYRLTGRSLVKRYRPGSTLERDSLTFSVARRSRSSRIRAREE